MSDSPQNITLNSFNLEDFSSKKFISSSVIKNFVINESSTTFIKRYIFLNITNTSLSICDSQQPTTPVVTTPPKIPIKWYTHLALYKPTGEWVSWELQTPDEAYPQGYDSQQYFYQGISPRVRIQWVTAS